jgi:DnaJ-class molecular chaperone
VVVPPGVKAGTLLRLKGLGKDAHQAPDSGDLFLKVAIKS